MAKKKYLTWITALVIISLCASGCGAKTETPADENVKVTSETPTPPKDKEESTDDDEYEEVEDESSGIPEAATSFAESLRKALSDLGAAMTVNDPEDQGDGKYTILLGGDSTLVYTIQTDGGSALSYQATIIGGKADVIKNVFSILVIALLDGSDEMQAAGDAIVSGVSPVVTEAYTFTSAEGEIDGQPFATLTAVLN